MEKERKRGSKKAISSVIVTVLLVMIGIVSVLIVYNFITLTIKSSSESSQSRLDSLINYLFGEETAETRGEGTTALTTGTEIIEYGTIEYNECNYSYSRTQNLLKTGDDFCEGGGGAKYYCSYIVFNVTDISLERNITSLSLGINVDEAISGYPCYISHISKEPSVIYDIELYNEIYANLSYEDPLDFCQSAGEKQIDLGSQALIDLKNQADNGWLGVGICSATTYGDTASFSNPRLIANLTAQAQAPASEEILLTGTELSSCQTLSEPGEYILTQDVSFSLERYSPLRGCFDIRGNNITLDMNNYKITTSLFFPQNYPEEGLYGIYISGSSNTVENGIINPYGQCLRSYISGGIFINGNYNHISNVKVEGGTPNPGYPWSIPQGGDIGLRISNSRGNIVSDSSFSDSMLNGIEITGDSENNQLEGVSVNNNGQCGDYEELNTAGIYVEGSGNNQLTGIWASNNFKYGIWLASDSNILEYSTSCNNTQTDIYCDSSGNTGKAIRATNVQQCDYEWPVLGVDYGNCSEECVSDFECIPGFYCENNACISSCQKFYNQLTQTYSV